MPTIKPRLTITLDPEIHETLLLLAHAKGQSASRVIADVLYVAHPVHVRMLENLKRLDLALQGHNLDVSNAIRKRLR